MSGGFKITGLKELQKKLEKMQKNAEKLSKTKSIPLDKLLSKSFISKNTSFKSFEHMMESGNFDISSTEAFKKIPDNELDKFISANTKFKSWQNMIDCATKEYAEKCLFG
ncbi:MAG: hypothetical protein IJ790_00715 [Lachnospiraceae bacterium]|nr:hypothetical protein [Lachnospiraceae bacterium]